jgi:hypothetical protein
VGNVRSGAVFEAANIVGVIALLAAHAYIFDAGQAGATTKTVAVVLAVVVAIIVAV